jgi:hypothetical protein
MNKQLQSQLEKIEQKLEWFLGSFYTSECGETFIIEGIYEDGSFLARSAVNSIIHFNRAGCSHSCSYKLMHLLSYSSKQEYLDAIDKFYKSKQDELNFILEVRKQNQNQREQE